MLALQHACMAGVAALWLTFASSPPHSETAGRACLCRHAPAGSRQAQGRAAPFGAEPGSVVLLRPLCHRFLSRSRTPPSAPNRPPSFALGHTPRAKLPALTMRSVCALSGLVLAVFEGDLSPRRGLPLRASRYLWTRSPLRFSTGSPRPACMLSGSLGCHTPGLVASLEACTRRKSAATRPGGVIWSRAWLCDAASSLAPPLPPPLTHTATRVRPFSSPSVPAPKAPALARVSRASALQLNSRSGKSRRRRSNSLPCGAHGIAYSADLPVRTRSALWPHPSPQASRCAQHARSRGSRSPRFTATFSPRRHLPLRALRCLQATPPSAFGPTFQGREPRTSWPVCTRRKSGWHKAGPCHLEPSLALWCCFAPCASASSLARACRQARQTHPPLSPAFGPHAHKAPHPCPCLALLLCCSSTRAPPLSTPPTLWQKQVHAQQLCTAQTSRRRLPSRPTCLHPARPLASPPHHASRCTLHLPSLGSCLPRLAATFSLRRCTPYVPCAVCRHAPLCVF